MKWLDKGYRLTRFADDWVVLCKTRNEAVKALNDARQILSKIGLTSILRKPELHILNGDLNF